MLWGNRVQIIDNSNSLNGAPADDHAVIGKVNQITPINKPNNLKNSDCYKDD